MTHAVPSHGDGFVVPADTTFILDQPDFYRKAFTPLAALNPDWVFRRRIPVPPGATEWVPRWADIEEAEYSQQHATLDPTTFAANFWSGVRAVDPKALMLARKEGYCGLLGQLTGGGYAPAESSTYTAVRLRGRGAPALVRWRLVDLHYATASDLEDYLDLPTYLAKDFGINRERAWRMAWVLVRYAMANDMQTIGNVVRAAETPDETPTKGVRSFDEILANHVKYARWRNS